ncbi:transcription factor Adf-1 [Elysia marginata]|uniref:Transcription factor Adf-1 n=1 Tax=Elysia marginata TaxID=1093978 RepID=A0AAV4I863_9GAST|nr:transcription factor Adf-1 [Elysia marginata]
MRARPALFDKRDKNYTNRDFVQRIWEQVAPELNDKAEEVKKRWTYLRDYYRKQKKFLGESKSRQAAVKKVEWPLFDTMSFLESFAECSQTHTNFAKSGTSDIELESTPSPYLEDSQKQLTQEDLDTSSGQELGNVAATDALSPPPPPLPSRKHKKPDKWRRLDDDDDDDHGDDNDDDHDDNHDDNDEDDDDDGGDDDDDSKVTMVVFYHDSDVSTCVTGVEEETNFICYIYQSGVKLKVAAFDAPSSSSPSPMSCVRFVRTCKGLKNRTQLALRLPLLKCTLYHQQTPLPTTSFH